VRHNTVNGCGSYREAETGSLLCRDLHTALCFLVAATSIVQIHGRAHDCLGIDHPLGPDLDAPNRTSCRWRQAVVEAFFEFL
jgi:hypothetical protein